MINKFDTILKVSETQVAYGPSYIWLHGVPVFMHFGHVACKAGGWQDFGTLRTRHHFALCSDWLQTWKGVNFGLLTYFELFIKGPRVGRNKTKPKVQIRTRVWRGGQDTHPEESRIHKAILNPIGAGRHKTTHKSCCVRGASEAQAVPM